MEARYYRSSRCGGATYFARQANGGTYGAFVSLLLGSQARHKQEVNYSIRVFAGLTTDCSATKDSCVID